MAAEPPTAPHEEETSLSQHPEDDDSSRNQSIDQSQTKNTAYNRDEVVIYPPPEGWPNLDKEFLSEAGKTETAIDLLRHIPYIKRGPEEEEDPYEIYDGTTAIDYTYEPTPLCYPEITELPAHVLTLAGTSHGGRNGFWLFLDTERGTITRCDFQDGPHLEDGRDGPEPWKLAQNKWEIDPEEEWRAYETYRVKDFFEFVKDQYRSLEMHPTGSREVRGGDPGKAVKLLFRDNGWPSDAFRRDECFEILEAVSSGDMDWPPQPSDSGSQPEGAKMRIPLR